jgi:hypothetical protein
MVGDACFMSPLRLAAGGGLAFAVSEFVRGHPSNGFARLGLAQPGAQRRYQQRAVRAAGIINKGDELRKRTERVSASLGNNPPERDEPSHMSDWGIIAYSHSPKRYQLGA